VEKAAAGIFDNEPHSWQNVIVLSRAGIFRPWGGRNAKFRGKGYRIMSFEAHLAELQKKHSELDRQIDEMLAHPSTDDLEISELKRRKLLLKDEIQRLSENAAG
jgi:hypothetical protein